MSMRLMLKFLADTFDRLMDKHLKAYLIPELDIESKINVEILMMIIMKDAIRLPRLPPIMLKSNSWVVNDPMVISVHHDETKRN